MAVQPSQSRFMTVDEWRKLQEHSDIKHEYIDGRIYAMAGGTLAHSFVAVNVVALLKSILHGRSCRAYNSSAAARLSPTRFTYPDATVTCDRDDHPTTKLREIKTPRVIVEVLSDTTEAYDRGMKFGFYRECPHVQEYVLVSTTYQLVEVFRRTPQGWTEYHAYGPGDQVELTSIDVHLLLAAFYEDTDVPESPNIPEREV